LFFFSSRRRHTRFSRDWSSDVCSSDLDLSSSVWMWYLDRETGDWAVRKVIEIPAEPAEPSTLPPLLQGFAAVPPLVSDINLSLDDRYLYVSCWGTGELRQYDVTDRFNPVFTGSARIGGIVRRTAHPRNPEKALNGGPQMVEVSRDGRRVYITNSLYSPWDAQFYPDGIRGWVAKLDVLPGGGIAFDERFLLELDEGYRSHQVRLAGGDSSSDPSATPDADGGERHAGVEHARRHDPAARRCARDQSRDGLAVRGIARVAGGARQCDVARARSACTRARARDRRNSACRGADRTRCADRAAALDRGNRAARVRCPQSHS